MNGKRIFLILMVVLTLSPAVAFGGARYSVGAVYVMNNNADDNGVVAFKRDFRGRLTPGRTYLTGGSGMGEGLDPLASQNSLIISPNKRWLFAVNAGSNSISVFRVRRHGLKLIGAFASGGIFPTSLTLYHNLLYVLNAGGDSPNIQGFRLHHRGRLELLTDATQPLPGSGFHQVGFSPHGDALVVTKGGGDADEILVFSVDEDGTIGDNPEATPSNGAVPFGFFFDWRGHLVVAEAGEQAVSTYELLDDNTLSVISPSVSNGNAATCWIAHTWFGAVFTANTGANNISAYKLWPGNGAIRLKVAEAATGFRPIDMATTVSGRFLYVLNAGDGTVPGTVGAFRILPGGKLKSIGTFGELPRLHTQGIAVR
ncbi:MAG: beta-propeller fold lactonase family protein [Desulfosarcinaceae bacterium]|jgi:DNA-binding beta-propeller fold protein YncE